MEDEKKEEIVEEVKEVVIGETNPMDLEEIKGE